MPNLDQIFRQVDDEGKGLSLNDFTDYSKSLLDNVRKWGKTAIVQGELQKLMPSLQTPIALSITKGTNATTSTVDPTKVNGAVTVSIFDPRLTLTHTIGVPADSNASIKPSDITLSDGSKTSALAGLRFATDAPAFELCFHETNATRIGIVVDGELLRTEKVRFANSGNRRYVRFDFGTDVVTYGKADTSIGISSGGTGHVVGDVITMNGGTNGVSGTPCSFVVAQIGTNGAATIVVVLDKGAYSALPTGNLTQVSSTGTGTGLVVTSMFFNKQHSTRKMRNIEVLWTGAGRCFGIVTGSTDVIQAHRGNIMSAKLVVQGDSLNSLTYGDYVGGHLGYIIAQKLGMSDNVVISAQGGTGWNKDNGAALRWSSPQRIADLLAHQGDLYLFMGSQNDLAGNDQERQALTASVTDTLNQIRAANPNVFLVGIGPILQNNASISDAIKAGFQAANDQKRTIYIDNVGEAWMSTTINNANWTNSHDTAHYGQTGTESIAHVSANRVMHEVAGLIRNPF